MTKEITLRLRYDGEHTKLVNSSKSASITEYLRKTLPRSYLNFPDIVAKVRNDLAKSIGERMAYGVSQALIDNAECKLTGDFLNRLLSAHVNGALNEFMTKLNYPKFSWVTSAHSGENKVTVYAAQFSYTDSEEHHTYEISWWSAA